MNDRSYRQRLEADLARWQADGLLPSTSADAIRATLRPVSEGVTIATVVGIVGGLLIAAAFLAFVAANWMAIARPMRFAILLAGIAGAYVSAAAFDRAGRTYLADLCVGMGSIVFGAAIALTGQMYHLGDDFAAGMLFWAAGALAAAVLTGSRSALAVALAAACVWSGMRVYEIAGIHAAFIGFWLIAAFLAFAWNAPVGRHLGALSALCWVFLAAIGLELGRHANPTFALVVGVSTLLGGGLVLAARGDESLRAFGLTLSNYAAFGLAVGLALVVTGAPIHIIRVMPLWLVATGLAAVILAAAAAGIQRRPGPALVAISLALALVMASDQIPTAKAGERWLDYGLVLTSMLCLIISGMLDDVRLRIVAGWLGLAASIAAITWALQGSLIRRAVFLAVAGLVAIVLAILLGRFIRKEPAP